MEQNKRKDYKEFYHFVNWVQPEIVQLWEDYNNRPDPVAGDMFVLNGEEVSFERVFFDGAFENGVAFWYIFKNKSGEEVKCYSINDVYDPKKLTSDNVKDIYGFWHYCQPVQ